MPVKIAAEAMRIHGLLLRDHVQAPSPAQRGIEDRIPEVRRERGDERIARAFGEGEPAPDRGDVGGELPSLDGDALGDARGARGEDHVSEVGPGGIALDRRALLARDSWPIRIDAQGRGARQRERLGEGRDGEHDDRAQTVEHPPEPLFRVRRVERGIGASGLEHAEQGDDGVDRGGHGDGDDDVRADAERPEVVGELVGPPIELCIVETNLARDERGRSGGARCVLFEELDDVRRSGG